MKCGEYFEKDNMYGVNFDCGICIFKEYIIHVKECMWCDQAKWVGTRKFCFFKIQPNKADSFFCFLFFVQSFNCLYLWNQLPNLCGVFTKFKPKQYLNGKCQKNKNHIFRLQTHFAWSHLIWPPTTFNTSNLNFCVKMEINGPSIVRCAVHSLTQWLQILQALVACPPLTNLIRALPHRSNKQQSQEATSTPMLNAL